MSRKKPTDQKLGIPTTRAKSKMNAFYLKELFPEEFRYGVPPSTPELKELTLWLNAASSKDDDQTNYVQNADLVHPNRYVRKIAEFELSKTKKTKVKRAKTITNNTDLDPIQALLNHSDPQVRASAEKLLQSINKPEEVELKLVKEKE